MDQFIVLSREGIFRMEPRRVVNPDAVLARLGEARASVIRNVASLNGASVSVQISANNTQMTAAVVVPDIQIRTWFAPMTAVDGTVSVTPVYTDNGIAVQQVRTWTVPAEFKLWLVYSEITGRERNTYTVLQHASSGACYLPPLGNIYPDSRVCMGDHWRRELTAAQIRLPIIDKLGEAVQWFNTQSFNTDLIGGDGARQAASQRMFRWDPANEAQRPVDVATILPMLARCGHHCWESIVASE